MKSFFTSPVLALSLLSVLACQGAQVAGTTPGQKTGTGGSTGNAGGAGGAVTAPSLDAPQIDLASGMGSNPPPATMTCAEEKQKAMQVPVALMLLVDTSSSMAAMVGASSKYAQVRQALEQFVAAPGSTGLELGMAFFPQPGSGSTCRSDADCGYPSLAPTPPPCQPTSICAKTVTAAGVAKLCGGRNPACPAGDTCMPLGTCAVSLDECTNVGQPCPGGAAGDTCVAVGKTCEFTDSESCNPAVYETLPVPIVSLPNPGQRLVVRAFERRGPSGGTPMRAAFDGTATALRKHLAAHPGKKSVIVLATDGAPSMGCPQNTVADVVKSLQDARASATAITTYVIGVATPNDANERAVLGQLATAGGSGTPFIISATENVAQRFLETLNQIRGQALPCEFAIPKPNMGAIDFAKVNVHWQGPSAQEDVLYTGTAARCDASKGGWYYDVDPATGTPTRVIVCEATCRKLKMQPDATVDLRFGCATRTID
jgi:Mg-chelatase subunit ChlD